MTLHRPILLAAMVLAALWPAAARADTLDLAFMPPQVVPQDLCLPGREDEEDDLTIGIGDDELTDAIRLQYIRRDIRNLQAQDADRWFDFIETLIAWQARLDPGFAGTGATLARIALHVDAGRLEDLQALGLIDQLRAGARNLTNAQRMILAQYYLNGIGVAEDADFARDLIRTSAYGGNPEALLAIARMELQGDPVPEWDAPLDMTVTLAFGGMLGEMNADVCGHAERIGQEYLNGDVVTRNPDIALAWFRFAADLGGASAAWRVVQFHLEAPADRKDNDEMLAYLRLAIARGIAVDAVQADRIRAVSNVDENLLRQMLGYNFSADDGRTRPSVAGYFQLRVNVDSPQADPDSLYLDYLREVILFDAAPGFAFTTLAQEVLFRVGRWAGEAEAMALLDEAARRGDAEGMQLLAQMLIRYRDDPAQLNRAVNLLTEAVDRYGRAGAIDDLDGLFRCQANEAPLPDQADYWAAAYRATEAQTVEISATDLIALDPFKVPETLAQIQTQALRGDPFSLARYMQLVQVDPLATEDAQRLWAGRTDNSDKALEVFAELEFSLATNPAERALAVELFRRVYLNNGVTTALDVSVALVEDNGRDPAVAAEIVAYLTQAGNRGEGAAIRLLARLTDAATPQSDTYQQFARIIADRGDFLALMFAIPYVNLETANDYVDRAVSLMSCGTKDVAELADAHTIMQAQDLTYHWQQIGLVIAYGDVLAKLAISDRQMDAYDTGAAPTARAVLERALADGDLAARRSLYALTANPDLPSYDAAAAADYLLALLPQAADEGFVLTQYRRADPDIRALVDARIDLAPVLRNAADRGDIVARRDYGLLLLGTATTLAEVQTAIGWLQRAAEGGDVVAMLEYGRILANGTGLPQDRAGALVWLDQAARGGNAEAAALARLQRLLVVP